MMDYGLVMEDINMSILEWADKAGDIDRIKFVYSDDNSKELISRLSVNGTFEGKGDTLLNGLVDQSDIIASLKELSEELLNDVKKGLQESK